MDPKSPLANAQIRVSEAMEVVGEWVNKGKKHHWDSVELCIALGSFGGYITYWDAVKLLDEEFHSSKLTPDCNAGFGWIKDEWKKLAKRGLDKTNETVL